MRKVFMLTAIVGALALVPSGAFAAPAKTATTSQAKAASHVTSGVVKSVDATSLVLTRSGRRGGELMLELSPSTERHGTVEIGSRVSVRYREDGKMHMATAITVQPAQASVRPASTNGKAAATKAKS